MQAQNWTGTTCRANLLRDLNRRCIHLRRAFASVLSQAKNISTEPSDLAFGAGASRHDATASAEQYALKYFAGSEAVIALRVRAEERLIVTL